MVRAAGGPADAGAAPAPGMAPEEVEVGEAIEPEPPVEHDGGPDALPPDDEADAAPGRRAPDAGP
ncbi:MAG: hypothetical protein R3F60_33560 [bacterium]